MVATAADPVSPGPTAEATGTQVETASPVTTATAVAVMERATTPTEQLDRSEHWAGLEPEPEPEAEPESDEASTRLPSSNPVRRLWSHRRTRMTLLGLGAFAAVLLIIWGIRLAHEGPSSDESFGTSGAQHSASRGTTAPTPASGLTAAQLRQFEDHAKALQEAGQAATKALTAAGSTPTQAALAGPVSTYAAALNLYDSQLHLIPWPTALQGAVTADSAQFEALVNYAKSLPAMSPTNMDNWLTGLHNRDSSTQQADNQVRVDLGLPAGSALP